MPAKYQYGVRYLSGITTPWPSKEAALENIETRVNLHKNWHEAAGYGPGDYADSGVLVRRRIIIADWELA